MRSKIIISTIFCVLLTYFRKFAYSQKNTNGGFIKRLSVTDFFHKNLSVDYRPSKTTQAVHKGSRSAPSTSLTPTQIVAVTEDSITETSMRPEEEKLHFIYNNFLSPKYHTAHMQIGPRYLVESWSGVETTPIVYKFDNVGGSRGSSVITPQDATTNIAEKINFKKMALTVCSASLQEALNCIKSALLFTDTAMHFVIFAEDVVAAEIAEVLNVWITLTDNRFYYELHSIVYPAEDLEYWKKSYTNCTGQKLFFPDLLLDIDALIYVDTDALFLGPADELWQVFSRFEERHIAALVPQRNAADSRAWTWYTRFAKHPFYGDFGLNAGVMLMNLTRMRNFEWVNHVQMTLRKWRHHILYSDQDVINIIFGYHPLKVLELSCRFNYRSGVSCAEAARGGILLLHGSMRLFHAPNNHQVFKAVYRAINGYAIGTDPLQTLLPSLVLLVTNASQSPTKYKNLKSSILRMPIKTLYKIK